MVARIIIGANYGDEGKGTVTAHYTKHANGAVLNVLTNGGPQRAHSILTESGSFTFQHFGSGTYHGADNYLSRFFIVNPFVFVDEYKRLTDSGLCVSLVYRDPRCRWTTPWDMMANQIKEELRKDKKHGSCGMGIWETVLRYRTTETIPFDEFMRRDRKDRIKYLDHVRSYYSRSFQMSEKWKKLFMSDHILNNFLADCEIFSKLTIQKQLYECRGYEEMIFENGQGLLLCDTGYDVPGTTPSNTSSLYAKHLLAGIQCDNVFTHYVTRTYMTRHGNGYLSEECRRSSLSREIQEDRTNHHNVHQGDFRYAPLDISALSDRINSYESGNPIIEITHCDEFDNVDEFKKTFSTINTYDSPLIT